ncbi:MBL fold metallo-hydrolase [Acidobacteria bacterium AH-259-D05]|nr:MBL fold metallo-hydrolase [Acidobacteria bacterium AH-259-D05]
MFNQKYEIPRVKATILPAFILTTALMSVGCSPTEYFMCQAVASQVNLFKTKGTGDSRFTKLTDRVYPYNRYWDRTLVIDTDEGLVVVDPFTPHLTRALSKEVEKARPTEPVHTPVSHYHLDHVGGGAVLEPEYVLADLHRLEDFRPGSWSVVLLIVVFSLLLCCFWPSRKC